MKIQFDKIETKKDIIIVFDGEKNIKISKKDFSKYLSSENTVPISGFVPNLENLTVTGDSVHKVTFNPEQNQKQIDLNKNHITVPSMSFVDLQAYTFDPIKKYRVHLNQDCMNNAGNYDTPLPTLIRRNNEIIEVIIDDGITEIGDFSFEGCGNLTSVTIPESVTKIGSFVFFNCSNLSSIYIPKNVETIFDGFIYCGLNSIEVSEENKNFSSVDGVLYNKDQTTLITYPIDKKDRTFTISNRINYIYEYAFYGNINIKDITYNGTKEQWESIQGSNLNFDGTVHCTNGDILCSSWEDEFF